MTQEGTKTELGNLKVTAPRVTEDLTTCPIRNVISRIGDSWSLATLLILAEKEKHFMELKRTLPGISQRVLTQTLRQLERDGLISRTVIPTVPVSVTYALTKLGQSLMEPAKNLLRWAEEANPVINAARQTYDVTHQNV
jgi:DNA-binding HxlR family transcriptional regulator